MVLDLAPESEAGVTNRFVTIGHTETRVVELTVDRSHLERGSMSNKDAERLRGRPQWFETFSHGRVASTNSEGGEQHGFGWDQEHVEVLGAKEIRALKFLRSRILTAAPRSHVHQSTNLVCVYGRSL